MAQLCCPTCKGSGWIQDPDHMEPAELRAIIGIVGHRLGYGCPMPQTDFAKLMDISTRTLSRYLGGERPITPLLARTARALKENSNFQVPQGWLRKHHATVRRKEHFRRKFTKLQKERGLIEPAAD